MAIRGDVEAVSRRVISGWCVDEQAEEPLEIEVRIEGLSLGTVRADIFRPDIAKAIDRPLAGFRFPISPELFRMLPHRGRVKVIAPSGAALPMLE